MPYKKSISNIAWEYSETENIFKLLKENNFDYIEIAPLEILRDWNYYDQKRITHFKMLLKEYDLKICSMQSVFYKKEINIFDNYTECINHFNILDMLCDKFDCKYIVFGAPKTRNIPHNISLKSAINTMNNFFLAFIP